MGTGAQLGVVMSSMASQWLFFSSPSPVSPGPTVSADTPTGQFLRDPDSLCSTISWRDEEDRVIWVYKIQVGGGGGHSQEGEDDHALLASEHGCWSVAVCLWSLRRGASGACCNEQTWSQLITWQWRPTQ
jgi:hypothetical protein